MNMDDKELELEIELTDRRLKVAKDFFNSGEYRTSAMHYRIAREKIERIAKAIEIKGDNHAV